VDDLDGVWLDAGVVMEHVQIMEAVVEIGRMLEAMV